MLSISPFYRWWRNYCKRSREITLAMGIVRMSDRLSLLSIYAPQRTQNLQIIQNGRFPCRHSANKLFLPRAAVEHKKEKKERSFPIRDLLLCDRLRRLVFIHVRAVWIRSRAGHIVFNVSVSRFAFVVAHYARKLLRFAKVVLKSFFGERRQDYSITDGASCMLGHREVLKSRIKRASHEDSRCHVQLREIVRKSLSATGEHVKQLISVKFYSVEPVIKRKKLKT